MLQLTTSVRGEKSVSTKLSKAIVEKLEAIYPGSRLTVKVLTRNSFPQLDEMHLPY